VQLDDHVAASRKRELALDFGGYLKGVALDRAASILAAQGVHDALLNIGGNVMALGSKNGQRWRVGIQHPRQPGPLATIELDDGEAIGTSGTTSVISRSTGGATATCSIPAAVSRWSTRRRSAS
jgi:thiamine biosynthesis lipoprotein